MTWQREFPHLYELFERSRQSDPDNYFSVIDPPRSELATASYKVWEDRLRRLDADSHANLLSRAAPYVSRRDTLNGRHWSALFDVLNEAKGYEYLLDEGYTTVRFIARTSRRTPDLVGENLLGSALCEVKTINVSDEDIAGRGSVQSVYYGIPLGLQRQLSSVYETACEQLRSVPLDGPVRRICFFCMSIDLPVALAAPNKQALDAYVRSITKDCEIFNQSQYWSN